MLRHTFSTALFRPRNDSETPVTLLPIVTVAKLLHPSNALYPSVPVTRCPMLVFTREHDPFYAAAPRLGHATTDRPDTITEAAVVVAQFLTPATAETESAA